jgi:hypothetical protein
MADTPIEPDTGEKERGHIRWAAVYEAMTGATAPGKHHEDIPGAHADSVRAGHEPDKFDAKGILLVPLIVVVTTGLAYVLITTLFSVLDPGQPAYADPRNPNAEVAAKAGFNDRAARIVSGDEAAPVKQPRLEGVQIVETNRNGQADPVYLRSFKPATTPANSPEITPQDLYPERYTEWRDGKEVRPLAEHGWVSKEKNVARIPVAEAMKIVAGKLPVKPAGKPIDSTVDVPKLSNGGQVANEGNVKPAEKKADAKKDDHDHKDEKK